MRKMSGFRLRLAQGFLIVAAVFLLLPMIQTFLYSFSSIPENEGLHENPGQL